MSEAAMLAQTALVSEKQTVSILSNKTTAQGQKLQLQVTPLATGYPMNQLGIWAKLDSGAARLIALFQTDTDAGVEIPSKTDVPDYVYTFYGLLEFTGSGGTLQVTIDASALVTAESMAAAIKEHNEDENAHEGIRQAITDKQDKITASGILRGDGKGGVTAQTFDTVPTENSDKLLTSGAVAAALAKKAGLGTDGKVPVSQLPVNTPGGVAGLGEDGKVGTGQLPINTPGAVAGIWNGRQETPISSHQYAGRRGRSRRGREDGHRSAPHQRAERHPDAGGRRQAQRGQSAAGRHDGADRCDRTNRLHGDSHAGNQGIHRDGERRKMDV